MQFKVFPYEYIRDAKNGLDAILQLEDKQSLNAVAFAAPRRKAGPHFATHTAESGSEPLLVTGGFYQYMSRCPDFGCAAWIAQRDGTVLHSWEIDPAKIVEGSSGFVPELDSRDIRVVSTRLTNDGGLVISFHARNTFPYTVGIVRIDKDSNILWKRLDGAHHWIDLDENGNIYAAFAKASDKKEFFPGSTVRQRCPLDQFHDDGIAVYSPEGELLRSFNFADILVQNDLQSALYANPDGCDPFHINSVEYLNAPMAAKLPSANAGDIMISVREANLVAIMDSASGMFSQHFIGYTTAQHSPHLTDDGKIVVFDNRGGNIEIGGTRILEIDPASGTARVIYPNPNAEENSLPPFWSEEGGHLDLSSDGERMIVSSKDQALTFEIEIATGNVLWSMEKIFDVTPYKKRTGFSDIADIVAFNAYSAHYLTQEDLGFLN